MSYSNTNKSILRTIIALAVVCLVISPVYATQVTRQLAPGVSLYQDINTNSGSELIVNAVTVDLNVNTVQVKPALGGNEVYLNDSTKGREAVSSTTARRGALVGINADFFPFTGDPLGVCVIDGELVSEPARSRAAFGLCKNRSVIFDNPILDARLTLSSGVTRQIDGINRARETNQVIVYTETWGVSTQGKYKGTDIVLTSNDLPVKIGKPINLTVTEVKADATDTPVPKGGLVISAGGPAAWFLKQNLKPGDILSISFNVKSTNNGDWSQVEEAVGGGPWLVKNGQITIDTLDEGFEKSFSSTKHPRTAIGVTADNKLLMVTIDGRQGISRGIALPDLAEWMKSLGAVNAINLDGGGSTTMSIKGLVVNSPSDSNERPVANSLLVFAEQPEIDKLANPTICGLDGQIIPGESRQLSLTWGSDRQLLTEDQQQSVIWGTTRGVGFVNQKGYFIPLRPGEGRVKALYGDQLIDASAKVIIGLPTRVSLELIPDQQDPAKAALKVIVYGAESNVLSGKEVAITVTGGSADVSSVITDDKGECSAIITWDPNAPEHSASVKSGDIVGSAMLNN